MKLYFRVSYFTHTSRSCNVVAVHLYGLTKQHQLADCPLVWSGGISPPGTDRVLCPRLQKTNNLEDPAECWLPSLYHHTNLSKSFCSGLAVSTLSKMLLPAECKTEGNGSSYCWIQITRPTDAFQVSTTTTKQMACSFGCCWFVLREKYCWLVAGD
jgi:hypothetical protein